MIWYKGSLYIAYDVINVTTNSSSTYIVKYSSNSTYTVFEESAQEKPSISQKCLLLIILYI
ncbi:hypothetical protein SJAV_20090 [Sulfurisphaera javensis]|uniref:Uncharacterized protein n=1 Tax=Sulfurisphaera javensis TaxID=2049879 RepID=A0AAT9GTV5_9CREN